MARVAELNPVDPQPFYQLAVFYEEKVRKDFRLAPARQTHYLRAATEAVDRALTLRPEYFEALVYENPILRHQARLAGDPQAERMLLEEADRLQEQALQVRNRQARGRPVP